MPKKVRELKALLSRAGFIWRPAKGSHGVWEHPSGLGRVTVAGKDGADAPRYMEKQVLQQIANVAGRR
jgi:predicted RNA binding protein YcfA (HicA-like mRNA interferase family)